MQNSRCVFNTAVALHRIFIAPIEGSSLAFQPRSSKSQLIARISIAPKLLPCYQTRSYAARAEKSRLPRDDEIRAWDVMLVSEDGVLSSSPLRTSDLLASIDRKTHSLVTVASGQQGEPPICKILDKKAMREAEKAKVVAARKSQVSTKTIELNWAIDGNDLGHRLQRVRDFLGKGNKVEVVMAPKRKGRKASQEEAEMLVERVRDVIGECGAKESKAMEGKLLGTATIYAEGKR